VRDGLVITALGLGVGLLGAIAATRLLRSMLYNVSPTDPISFLLTAASLLLVALVASWLPARRAARIDPAVALRGD
jgi:putative ABC transport system permease protein